MQSANAYRSPRRPLRTLRRIGLLIGAAAFLLQMLTWSVYAPAMAAGEATEICTAEGMIIVLLDADGQPITPEKTAPDNKHCGFCLLAQGLAAAPTTIIASPPQNVARHGAEALPGAVIAAGWFLSTLQARAPPIIG
jgi:hypothetical protein